MSMIYEILTFVCNPEEFWSVRKENIDAVFFQEPD